MELFLRYGSNKRSRQKQTKQKTTHNRKSWQEIGADTSQTAANIKKKQQVAANISKGQETAAESSK